MKKRSDGRYQLSIMIGYGDDGKPKRKLVYGRTQKEVREKANELRMQHSMGIEIDNNITVAEWAETWLKTYKTGVEYKTHQMYSDSLRLYIVNPLGRLKLRDVKTAHLQKIANDNSHKTKTIKNFKMTASQMFEQAVLNDLILKNPAKGIVLPVSVPSTKKRALTESEIEAIKSLEIDSKTRCFIFFLLYTGARKGEALAITKSDIDRDKLEINISKSLVFKGNQSEVKHNPKTKAGVRSIPVLDPLKAILFAHIDSIDTELLFPSANNNTMSDTAYRRMWQKFETAIGTKEITAHIFRHNFATLLYNAGVDIKTAQSILGHSSINITMDIYTHLDARNRTTAAAKLNDYLSISVD